MSQTKKTVLETMIKTFFNVEFDELVTLANWVRGEHSTEAELEISQFKTQLREALDRPGIITPEIYERCTYNDEFDTQDKVQQRLQETWDACFGSP